MAAKSSHTSNQIRLPFCLCGCGQMTRVPKWSCATFGWVRGIPLRYIKGHNQRGAVQSAIHKARIGLANTGKVRSEATKALLSQKLRRHPALTGPAHPMWKDGKAASRRGANGLQWSRWVKRRDNYTCRECGYVSADKRGLHAHHLKPFSKFPELRHDIGNGITLCADCHFRVHHPEAGPRPKTWGHGRLTT
jgi:5-methylcytosine-specific restriction endonuclease McrA